MENEEHIVRYTAEEIDEMIRRGEDRTDWARVAAKTDEEVEAAIDFEEEGEPDWSTGMAGIPLPKRALTVELDGDIIDWFKAHDGDHQRTMNKVLRRYVEAEKQKAREAEQAEHGAAAHR